MNPTCLWDLFGASMLGRFWFLICSAQEKEARVKLCICSGACRDYICNTWQYTHPENNFWILQKRCSPTISKSWGLSQEIAHRKHHVRRELMIVVGLDGQSTHLISVRLEHSLYDLGVFLAFLSLYLKMSLCKGNLFRRCPRTLANVVWP